MPQKISSSLKHGLSEYICACIHFIFDQLYTCFYEVCWLSCVCVNSVLECDAECALIERNRRLALALEIKNPDLSNKLGTPSFSDFLKDFAK